MALHFQEKKKRWRTFDVELLTKTPIIYFTCNFHSSIPVCFAWYVYHLFILLWWDGQTSCDDEDSYDLRCWLQCFNLL